MKLRSVVRLDSNIHLRPPQGIKLGHVAANAEVFIKHFGFRPSVQATFRQFVTRLRYKPSTSRVLQGFRSSQDPSCRCETRNGRGSDSCVMFSSGFFWLEGLRFSCDFMVSPDLESEIPKKKIRDHFGWEHSLREFQIWRNTGII